ncbi:hypothetical protein M2132_000290 [Dysgonomonas sp. PH5-45]|uniref:DUF4301 family protein n=1 Tax=unclassified Dysgonomonas TaxID=2630389 RepID=UPI002475B279|nr:MULTISPECIES: DUF4301 family protein [unclassified Dysgonomonas]MDH6353970.1 hypothetical protein [Dysgonomonas sp. PH5-45]MDH6386872.1 hypothetical protein [Dysgonomonas sp. PH5-37]
MFTEQDVNFLNKKGISLEEIERQIENFKTGFPFLKLHSAAAVGNGIKTVSPQEESSFLNEWNNYCASNKTIIKFVPASGAASRMFKNLFEFLDASYDVPTSDFEKKFFDNIEKFAFYQDLDAACLRNDYKSIKELLANGNYKHVVANLLSTKGLNYGNLPKGLLKFHRYANGYSCTPVEEHLKEGAIYAKNSQGMVNIHFTVSPEHNLLFNQLIDDKKPVLENELSTHFEVNFSEQKPKTDTIAVDMNNEPFREENGELVFRPGGHGALIENLNDLSADIIFIKNIDNVVPDRLKQNEAKYKKILAGVLVEVQQKAFECLKLIDSGKYTHDELIEILEFVQQTLNIKNPEAKLLEDVELVLYLKKKLDRPFRVCGMVKNVGEPGGGPFFAQNPDGTISLQILESSQIDMNDDVSREMFEKGTHFNPVDLVCGVKDYRGHKLNLLNYVDKNTGFISIKSKGGKELKALELPGLWNGAMSDWNTIFVEVPIETFNPVKTVNDLLRDQHQA